MHDMSFPRLSARADAAEVPAADDLPLDVRGLRFTRSGQTLIDIPDLSIQAGGPTMILGPNGAGKSILARILHGLLEPCAGQVQVAGAPLTGEQRARQAMVFQRPVLLRRSVAGNLHYVLRNRGVQRAERRDRVRALLEHGDLADKARQPARSLSGGEEQRLALIRAMACEPSILFLDEPTSSLDPSATQRIESLIHFAAQAGTKIIMVTHDLGQARRLGQDIVFLNGGRVQEHTPAETFFDNPQSGAARAFLQGHLLI